MKQTCMIIRGAIPVDGAEMKFRPSSNWPTHHWTTMLIDNFASRAHFYIQYIEDEFVVSITAKAKEEDADLFEHIMKFAKLHGLDHTECRTQCEKCEGHEQCITEHK